MAVVCEGSERERERRGEERRGEERRGEERRERGGGGAEAELVNTVFKFKAVLPQCKSPFIVIHDVMLGCSLRAWLKVELRARKTWLESTLPGLIKKALVIKVTYM